MKSKIPSFLMERQSSAFLAGYGGKVNDSYIEKGIRLLADVTSIGHAQWESASADGLFQRIDARVKLIFLLLYVLIVSLKMELMPEIYIGCFVMMLVMLSRLNIFGFYKRVVLIAFLFGFLIALPSAFNLITKGDVIFPLLHLSKDYHFWIYHIPAEIGVTVEGLNVVALLTFRVFNSLAISFLVLYTTTFPDIIKALKVLKVPDSFLMIVTLSYKYIFIFAKTVEDMHLAKKGRLAGRVSNTDARGWIAGRIIFIFKKTRLRCEEIFKAMLSRGFSEKIRFREPDKLSAFDIVSGFALLLAGAMLLFV